METLNFTDLKIKSPKAPATVYGKGYFEEVEYTIQRINKFFKRKGKIVEGQKGEYEILTYAMENEVNGDALVYALSLSRDNIEKAREIIKK